MESDERKELRDRLARNIDEKKGLISDPNEERKLFDEDSVEYAHRRLDELLVYAMDKLDSLLNSEDEKTSFSVAKYIIDRAFGSTSPSNGKHIDKEDDPLWNFLDRITGQRED